MPGPRSGRATRALKNASPVALAALPRADRRTRLPGQADVAPLQNRLCERPFPWRLRDTLGRMEAAVGGEREPSRLRWGLLACAILVLVWMGTQAPVAEWMVHINETIADLGAWGPVVFAACYIAATLLLIPGSLMTLAAGALFGTVLGTATVSLAATSSAALAFLISRYVAREAIEKRTEKQPRFGAIDRAIGEQGWKIVGLLRLTPVVPFSLSNYLFGLTAIPFGPYVAVSWLAMLPATFLYVYLGDLAATGVETAVGAPGSSPEAIEWSLRILGAVATIAVTILITRMARRALRETTDIETSAAPHEPPHPGTSHD